MSHILTEKDINIARDYAFEKHKSQWYGNHPYSFHLKGVAYHVTRHYEQKDELTTISKLGDFIVRDSIICAYLHDIIEDYKYTKVTLQDIESLFDSAIEEYVELLTHKDGVSYADYIKQTASRLVPHVVKMADLKFNIEQSTKTLEKKFTKYVKQRLEKYQLALLYLEELYEQRYKQNT